MWRRLAFIAAVAADATSSSVRWKAACSKLAEVEGKVQSAEIVDNLGSVAEEILQTAPPELVLARLEVVFAKQVRLLRERAIEKLRLASNAQTDDFETQCEVEAEFLADVKKSMPPTADWEYAIETIGLADAARLLIEKKKSAADIQIQAAKQQAHFMRIFQTFASHIQQLQATQFTRGGLPLQAGFAYRIQDNINLSGSYQQGRARLELQNIDDDTVLSGDPQFIAAPSRGNLGVTFNSA